MKKSFEIVKNIPENEKTVISKFLTELIKSLYDRKIIQNARLCLTCSNFVKNNDENSEMPFLCKFAKVSFDYKGVHFNCSNYLSAKNME